MPEQSHPNELSNPTDIMEKLHERPVTLINKGLRMTLENVQELAKGKPILVCDVNIDELVKVGEPITGGYKKDNIIDIDHHFDGDPRFVGHISSTNLAIDYVNENGPIEGDVKTIINHVDTDSILSSGVMRGILPPNKEFGEAAIAADHTGEPNRITDLLQSLYIKRDVEFSFRNLQLLLQGEKLEPEAARMLEIHLQNRERARQLAKDFSFTEDGSIAYIELPDGHFDSGLFLPFLDSEITVVFSPRSLKDEDGQPLPGKQAKIRLGKKAKDGIDLRKIIRPFDKNFGGRWNGGGNDRWGGLEIDPQEYIREISESLSKL